jgi:hypothetical protein
MEFERPEYPIGVVYFVRCPANGLVKIGRTKHSDVLYRLIGLLTTSPVPLEVLGTVTAGREYELSMHVAFAGSWHHNEWFEPTPELLDFIKKRIQPWDAGPLMEHVAKQAAQRRAKLLIEHGKLYSHSGCSFDHACDVCGEFLAAGVSGSCRRCQERAEANKEPDWDYIKAAKSDSSRWGMRGNI